jgi:hypothetical protein
VLAPLTYTGRSPAEALARLRAAGIALDPRAPPPAERGDLGLLELSLAPRTEAGAERVALARLVYRPGLPPAPGAVLAVEVECADERRSFEVPLPLRAGEFELPIACGPAGFGRNLVRARCRLDGGPDLYPENDQARAVTLAEGARVVGVVAPAGRRAAAEDWLAPAGRAGLAGFQFAFLEPEEVARELAGLAALVSFDVAPSALPAAPVASFVERGGGWLALSGWSLLDDWIPGAEQDRLAQLLPCLPAQRDAPERDVVLLVDGSGSMAGAPFEVLRSAALALVAAALPSDRVSLRFFTVRLEPEHVLKPRVASRAEDLAAARSAARDLLRLRQPTGATFLAKSLREFAATLGGKETLALLLTDGRERDALADAVGTARAVAAEIGARRARLVVIAVGDADLELLAALAGSAEEVRPGNSLAELETVFRRELVGARVAEGELRVRPAPRAQGSLADEIESAAAPERALPPLERSVRNRLRPGAESLWVGPEGEPVLAAARAGLGRTALFSSSPVAGWASRYLRPGLGEPAEFEGLLRWLARGGAGPVLPRARLEGRRIHVGGLEPGRPATLAAVLASPSDPAWSHPLRLTPPAAFGRDVRTAREAEVALDLPADALLLLSAGGGAELALPVERSLPDELAWRERSVPSAWLGGPAGSPALPRGPGSHRAATLVLFLALALLLGGGLVRARGQGAAPSDR